MPDYRIERLKKHHVRAGFSCGSPPLDRYIQQQARQDQTRGAAVVYVLCPVENDQVAGFFTLSACSIEATGLQPDHARRLPRYPLLPAILLGRLAVDLRFQGQRLGVAVLGEALTTSLSVSDRIDAVAVIVDAKDDESLRFYEKHGFIPFLNDDRRLYLPIDTLAKGVLLV
ncbi:MAG: GNAT family N-acetyltransferase [Nitrolancea sp.]